MRIERWWWLLVFSVVSLAIHALIGWKSPSLRFAIAAPPPEGLEIALEPLPPQPKPEPKLKPKPEPKPERTPEPKTAAKPPARAPKPAKPPRTRMAYARTAGVRTETPSRIDTAERRAPSPTTAPGGTDPTREEAPLLQGLPAGKRQSAPLMRMARADLPAPDRLAGEEGGGPQGGGGSPAPGPVLGGRGGAPGPEAPPEDILFNGGGAGGVDLPRAAPRIGGGGGRSMLSVKNPLAKEAIPEDAPGLGPGAGGGQGAGAGGGAGFGRGRGIGTRPDGKYALATQNSRPGRGIGAGEGDGIGTRPPGGGRGTGAELPGTGGEGLGYGRGRGSGAGDGSGIGVGSGPGRGIGRGRGSGTGDGDGDGEGGRLALNRGIPFGDILGLLRGDPRGGGGRGGGPGGPGRGAGKGSPGGGDDRVRIVYVLDTSTSMFQGRKILRAREALKKALSELKPGDSFNLIHFDVWAYQAADEMVPATPENIQKASEYIELLPLRGGTNISAGMEAALALKDVTHIFLLSDGEPSRGITDADQLRTLIRERNRGRVRIITLALGLGEQFPGIPLLKGIAEENGGEFKYVNLARPAPTASP